MSDTDTTAKPARRARGGGGAARRAARTAVSFETAKYIERNIPNYEVLDEAALDIIETNAETVLAEIGVIFSDNEFALDLWRKAGADIDGERVRIPRGMARELIKTAPSQYTQVGRDRSKDVVVGGKNLVLAPVYGPPFVRDMEGGRRYATIEDFRNFVKLGYMSKWLHHSGGTVCEPTDVAVNKRHLDMLLAHMTLSDKPFMGSVTEPSRAQDSVDMCEILFGKEFVQENTCMTSLININSPLTFDGIMMGAMEIFARNNQASIISPFIVGGAMAPVSIAGTLTQVMAASWCACCGWCVCFLNRHEFRCANIWHARSGPSDIWRWSNRSTPQFALSFWWLFLWFKTARCTGWIRNRQHAFQCIVGWGELYVALLWLARRRLGGLV